MAHHGAVAFDREAAGARAVIAFGASIGEVEPFRDHAEPGILRAAEPGAEIYRFAASGPISRTYNLMLDAAGRHDDLEALVLVHSHVEIVDPGFCAKVREAMRDPEVAVLGCTGSTGATGIAWWEGAVRTAPVVQHYGEHGGGEMVAFSWAEHEPAPGEVDTLDGFLLVLSPWAVRNVRFDEALALGHGFDLDYCLQVRAQGRKLMTADLRVIHHRGLELISDLELWAEAHIQVAEKWEGRFPGVEPSTLDWKRRARRAEAEREAARAMAHSNALASDARVLELERRLEALTDTASWRITEPLRRLNVWRARAAERRNRS